MQIRTSSALGLIAWAALAHSAAGASVDLSFFRLTDSGAPDIAGQIRLTVSGVEGQPGLIDFTFSNEVGTRSSITDIFFADGAILGKASVVQSGSLFVGARSTMAGANLLDPEFVTTRAFRTAAGLFNDNGSAVNPTGLDRAEDFVTFRFELKNGATTDDVTAALSAAATPYGNIRVGVIARSIGGSGGSDSFSNFALLSVPIPAAAWTGVLGLGAVAGVAWIRRRDHRRA